MEKEKRNKFRHPSYTGMFILILAVVLLFGLTIWQCAKINTLYKANIRKVEEISTALQELEDYANDAVADTEDSQQRIVINITYPAVLESDDISLEGLISMVQAENAEMLENFNNYIVIFSILITVVVIVIPVFNYAFIQKDQIRRLDEQYGAFDEQFKKMNVRFGGEIKRLENAIEESHSVSSSLIPDKAGRESADIKPISDKPKDRARALALSARIDFANKRYDEAIRKISEAICLAKDRAEYYSTRSIMYHQREMYEKALIDANMAIELEPGNARYYNNRGTTLHEMGKYEEALADATKAIELEPGNAGYYDSRGVTLHEMGKYEEALADKTKAIELEPGNAGYYNSRGVTLHALKRYEEALADKTKAVELEPGNAGYYDSRGTTLHKMGRYEEALTDATKAIELEPGNAGYYDSRAITYFRMKDYLKALIDAKKAYSIDSLDLEFKYDLARVLYFSGLPEDAFEYIREIPKKCNYASAFRTRALTKIRLKHCNEEEVTEDFVKEVTADLEHAIELDTENVNSFIDFAIAMLLLEKPKEVIEKLEAARKIDPEEPEVYHWYAEYYRKTGDAQKAAEYDRIADEKGYIPEPDDT